MGNLVYPGETEARDSAIRDLIWGEHLKAFNTIFIGYGVAPSNLRALNGKTSEQGTAP